MITSSSPKPSQVEPTEFVKKLIKDNAVSRIETTEDLIKLRKVLVKMLHELPYNEETKVAEEKIRWTRTGSQVLEDGFVYKTKSCTDIVVAYITLAIAAGVTAARFVKVQDPQTTMRHSFAEFKLKDGWYRYDVSLGKAIPEKGAVTKNKPIYFNGALTNFRLWKKGRDSWSLGLDDYASGLKINMKK